MNCQRKRRRHCLFDDSGFDRWWARQWLRDWANLFLVPGQEVWQSSVAPVPSLPRSIPVSDTSFAVCCKTVGEGRNSVQCLVSMPWDLCLFKNLL